VSRVQNSFRILIARHIRLKSITALTHRTVIQKTRNADQTARLSVVVHFLVRQRLQVEPVVVAAYVIRSSTFLATRQMRFAMVQRHLSLYKPWRATKSIQQVAAALVLVTTLALLRFTYLPVGM